MWVSSECQIVTYILAAVISGPFWVYQRVSTEVHVRELPATKLIGSGQQQCQSRILSTSAAGISELGTDQHGDGTAATHLWWEVWWANTQSVNSISETYDHACINKREKIVNMTWILYCISYLSYLYSSLVMSDRSTPPMKELYSLTMAGHWMLTMRFSWRLNRETVVTGLHATYDDTSWTGELSYQHTTAILWVVLIR